MTLPSINNTPIENKRVLLRVDYNVSLTNKGKIADDARITQTLPTLQLLLKNNNKLLLIAHLGEPNSRDEKYSLKPVVEDVQRLLPDYKFILVNDFLSDEGKAHIAQQQTNEVLMLENLRFYPGEQRNDPQFSQELANLADVYVNDAFGVSHRNAASVVGVPKLLPHYAGLLMEKEITAISRVMENPKKPVVAIIGGAKTSTKLPLLYKLTEIADHLLLGGGIANTFLKADGFVMGKSLIEEGQDEEVKKILNHAKEKNTTVVLPRDAICGTDGKAEIGEEIAVNHLSPETSVFDIGPETQALYGNIIANANTIVWNGPVGYTENPVFSRGTEFLYYAITQNDHAYSVVGGGDTLAAINKKEYLDKITHISTGGGAMLEFIEKGTLPGIEALKS